MFRDPTGDTLTATVGGWIGNTDPFTYQWQRCDNLGTPASCVDIGGKTSVGYLVSHPDDDGNTLRVVVTAHGLNGDTSIIERARFDNQYIEYWSPWLDVIILARTLAAAITRRQEGER